MLISRPPMPTPVLSNRLVAAAAKGEEEKNNS